MNQKQNKLKAKLLTQNSNTHGCCVYTIISSLCLIYGMVFLCGITEAYAGFDFDKIGTDILQPVVKFVDNHYGKGILTVGAASAIVSPGNLYDRGIGLFKGVAASGLAMYALKIGLGIED